MSKELQRKLDESLGTLLLHRTHKRNIDFTLKSNISFIELLTKSMEN